jgi:hypothetical protein
MMSTGCTAEHVGAERIGDTIARLLARGDLPWRVQSTRPLDGVPAGTVFTWVPVERAYVAERGQMLALAPFVQRNWGGLFVAAPAHQMELAAS